MFNLILSKVTPDNNYGGYGSLDTEKLFTFLTIFLTIITITLLVYILFLHSKIDKLKYKLNSINETKEN